ncbi:5-hydroxytryptamine receptor 3A-like [Pyxicephalus adspersus]|uniref:5-hydroxytryptamine receptor 3A-like n=1 Tax=Pyxicephalus adspersus TaxID=30357 RepID=UPI003B5CF7DB
MTWMYPTLFSFCLFIACTGEATSKEKIKLKNATFVKLANYLMDGYNKAVRPVQNWMQATTVTINIDLFAILEVDEKNQLISTYVWYDEYWLDDFLSWDPKNFDNVKKISLPTQKLWLPDITVVESVNEEKPREISYLYINNNGRVFRSKPMHIVSSCSLEIYYFPFDRQNCSLTFVSWSLTTKDIDLNFSKPDDHDKTFFPIYKTKEGEWELVEVIPKYRQFKEKGVSFGEVIYFIIIKRRPLFYTVNLLFPSMLLLVMDIVGFYLPPESGERISFKITLLLGYSVFLIIVSEQLPASGTPLIAVYFILCMVMLVISLMESIIIVRIIHKQNIHPEVPSWLMKLIVKIVAPLVCLKEWAQIIKPAEDSSTETSTEKLTSYCNENALDDTRQLPVGKDFELLRNILKEVESIHVHLKKSDHEYIIQEWLTIGYIIDKLLFRAYLIFLLITTISFAGVWARWNLN